MLLRYLLRLWLVLALIAPSYAKDAGTQEVYVPLAKDLNAIGNLAQQKQLPILLLVAAEWCSYCTLIQDEFLEPMIKSGNYDDKVLIRVMYMDSGETLRSFEGDPVPADQLAARYKVKLTPTVLFLGPNGEELAPRIVGISSPDYYGAYLDQHIEAAAEQLRSG
jgi:thioredoxin-related protein